VRDDPYKFSGCAIGLLALFLLCSESVFSQQDSYAPEVPAHFKIDLETAARLRPRLFRESVAPSGQFAIGPAVLNKLVPQVVAPEGVKPAWELRIIEDGQFNAYSSPDGTIYVESGLAQLAGASSGLWAAILSHEIAHIVRRDWARRYLYQKHLESNSGAVIALGDPTVPASSWSDGSNASGDLERFCRQMELDADRESLRLMARAGYHPDFVPALHHLLHAQSPQATSRALYATHPCWEERDRELSRAYEDASIEFGRLWPERYKSPGGNPPLVVFTEEPKVTRTISGRWEVKVYIRCQNLAGAVEVVLHSAGSVGSQKEWDNVDSINSDNEVRQITGCTTPRTMITFALSERSSHPKPWTDLYVLDAWGAVLARVDFPTPRQ
jgi:hypothetical protein